MIAHSKSPTLFPMEEATLKQLLADGAVKYAAKFSPCEKYRFWLSRIWNSDQPFVNFLLLNPSKATHLIDDPTMIRCMNYAFDWRFGGQITTNIHDFRATLPEDMKAQGDLSFSPDNDAAILDVAKRAGLVVCGWGNHGAFRGRGKRVLELLRSNGIVPHALKVNADGSPNHPLYLKKTLRPFPIP